MEIDLTPRIDGSELLADVRDWLARFIVTTTEGDLDLLTLWAAHTHLVREVYTTPRLQLDSPVPEAGKTTALEHLQRLCVRPVLMAVVSSPAMLTRMLQTEIRTLLVDEADRSLKLDKPGVDDLYAVINSGYKRGGTRPVLVPGANGQWEVSEMSTFAPVALAGNQPDLPDDTRSRIIRVLLLPDFDGTAEETNWELIEDEATSLRERLAAWADEVRDGVRTSQPRMPAGIVARFREKWQPLRKVADAAGGPWPEIVDGLALLDRAEFEAGKEDGMVREAPGVVLLKHIHELWPTETAFWPTTLLIDRLVINYPFVWGVEGPFHKRLTPQRLGRMLTKSYKVQSHQPTHGGPRGYFRADFIRPWHRMGIPLLVTDSSDATEETDEPSSSVPSLPSIESVSGVGGCLSATGWADCVNPNCRAFQTCAQGE